jgi:CBS-domain-containing membrane protein
MSKDVACVRESETLSAAAKIMWDCDCGSVPVLDEAGQKLVGMITDRDICMSTWSKDSAPSSIKVADVMSRQISACSPEDNLATAEGIMRSRRVRRVPVVDSAGKIVGMLSLADIARKADRERNQQTSQEITAEEIAATLANVCQERSERPHA